jgi:hypothetical protein
MSHLSNYVKIFLLTLALSVLSPLAHSNSPEKACTQALTSLVKADLERALQPLQLEFAFMRSDIEKAIVRDAEACGGLENPACAQKVLSAAMTEPRATQRLARFLDDKKEMTCVLSKQRAAREKLIASSNMALNLSAAIGTMGYFHYQSLQEAKRHETPPPQFNYALAASVVAIVIYRSIVQCQNELASIGGGEATFRQKFARYTQLNLIGNGIYVGLLAGQDAIQGQNPFEKDNLKRYFHEFVYSLAWDTGFSVVNIKLMDKFFLHRLPKVREGIAESINRGVIRPVFTRLNGKPTILLKVENLSHVPGF